MQISKVFTLYDDLINLGKENNLFIDKFYSAMLALTPILQHYIGLGVNMGFTVFIAAFPWIWVRFIYKMKSCARIKFKLHDILIGVYLFIIYRTFIHETTILSFVYNFMLLFYFAAAAFGCINIRVFFKTSLFISLLASLIIGIQTIVYYALKLHLQVVPTNLLLPSADIWIMGAKTGLVGVTGREGTLYRPSAFFLEPSHMFLYLFPNLFMLLYSRNINKYKFRTALFLSVGLLLTTSGMGIVTLFCCWCGYLVLSNGKNNVFKLISLVRTKNILTTAVLLLLTIVVYVYIPFVNEAVSRFLDSSNGGAIAGRTRLSNELLKELYGYAYFFGVTSVIEGIDFNLSGYASTFYKFGIVGIILSYSFYIVGLFRLREQYFWICLFVLGISFFTAHTHGTFYMIYFIFLLLEGNSYSVNRNKYVL